jgi:putative oxidoreductase
MTRKSSAALLAGRLGLSIIFLVSGLGKLASWRSTVAFAGAKGVPEILLAGATALEILGALSLVAGWKIRWGVAALVVFLVPVTLVFHDFWAYQGAEAQLQVVQLLKNVGIGGGLLAVLGAGPGAFSVDARRSPVAAKEVTRSVEPEAFARATEKGA